MGCVPFSEKNQQLPEDFVYFPVMVIENGHIISEP